MRRPRHLSRVLIGGKFRNTHIRQPLVCLHYLNSVSWGRVDTVFTKFCAANWFHETFLICWNGRARRNQAPSFRAPLAEELVVAVMSNQIRVSLTFHMLRVERSAVPMRVYSWQQCLPPDCWDQAMWWCLGEHPRPDLLSVTTGQSIFKAQL